jgi:hypothetical protein
MQSDSQKKVRHEIDQASEQVGALCELLAAAQERKVSASSIHVMLRPIATQLDYAAGTLSDSQIR